MKGQIEEGEVRQILHLMHQSSVQNWACLFLDHSGEQKAITYLVGIFMLFPFPAEIPKW